MIRQGKIKFLSCIATCFILLIAKAAEVETHEKTEKFQYGKQVAGLSLSIKPEVNTVELGYIVYIVVRIKNTSNQTQNILLISPEIQYFFDVTTSSGEKIPTLLYQQNLDKRENQDFLRIFGRPLKPGEFLEHKFNLSRRFDFSLHGDYIVQCRRELILFDRIKKKRSVDNVFSPKLRFAIKYNRDENHNSGSSR